MVPLAYLKKELGFTVAEWQKLSDTDKEWYREAARVEMEVLGIV